MSGARAALVEALNKLDGISVTSTSPPAIVPGSAWPGWSSTTWLNACATSEEWFVFVALTGDDAAAPDARGAALDDIATVLWPVGKVTRVEPWRFAVEPGQQAVPVLRFTLEI